MSERGQQKVSRFVAAEMVNGTCYAYAEMKGELIGESLDLRWRCPVKAYSDDPVKRGEARVQVVEDRLCDFGVSPGDRGTRDIDVEIFKMY